MTDYEAPDYSISELILCAILIGASLCYFMYAGYQFYLDKNLSATEYAGIGLLALGGSVDPLKHFIDGFTFPLSFIQNAGRDTWVTRIAIALGFLMWLIGISGNWISRYL